MCCRFQAWLDFMCCFFLSPCQMLKSIEDSSRGFCRLLISPLRSHPCLFSLPLTDGESKGIGSVLPRSCCSCPTREVQRRLQGKSETPQVFCCFFFSSLVLALTVANLAQSRAASWSSCCLPRSCLPRAADAHSRSSDVGMELDQICLFIHEMAWLAKTRTRWGTVGDPWAHTPCFFFLAARMRVCRCPDRGLG